MNLELFIDYSCNIGYSIYLFMLEFLKNFNYSQNAGLCPAMLTITVSVRRGNFGKFVLSRFHGHGTSLDQNSRYYFGDTCTEPKM